MRNQLESHLHAYMQARGIPGGQFAAGRHGQIEFTLNLGLADRDNALPVRPVTRFRIASLTKPLTAAAILTLVESGALTLETRMLDVLKTDIFLPGDRQPDPRLGDITIRHLLQHTAGWDRMQSGDVMFFGLRIARALGIPSPPSPRDFIREVLGRPLDFNPGERYAYSNFGYCVLGRIIEDLSRQSYEHYVQQHVLRPAGIHGPRLGSTLTQAEDEARYSMISGDPGDGPGTPIFSLLPSPVDRPYGTWSLEAMDSHGGWIARAEDMVRFAMSLDDIGRTSPFQKHETWQAMTAPSPGPAGHDEQGQPLPSSYACGFKVQRGSDGLTLSHSGSLSGTSSHLVRRADGWCWCLLFNQRHHLGDREQVLIAPIEQIFDTVH